MELSTNVGSDHCTVKIIILIKPVKIEIKNIRKFITANKTELENFSMIINRCNIEKPINIETLKNDITQRITASAKNYIKRIFVVKLQTKSAHPGGIATAIEW